MAGRFWCTAPIVFVRSLPFPTAPSFRIGDHPRTGGECRTIATANSGEASVAAVRHSRYWRRARGPSELRHAAARRGRPHRADRGRYRAGRGCVEGRIAGCSCWRVQPLRHQTAHGRQSGQFGAPVPAGRNARQSSGVALMSPKSRLDRMARIAAPVPFLLPDAAAVRPTCILEFIR